MVDIGKMVERAADTPEEAAEAFQKARKEKRRKQAERRRAEAAKQLARNVAFLGGVLVAAAIALGWISVNISPLVGGLVFAGLVGMSYALFENDDELSITFALSAVAIGMVLAEFVLPGWVTAPIVDVLPTELVTGWNPVEFAVLAAAVILAWWFIDIRFISRSGVKAETVAKRMRKRVEKLVGEWFSITRVSIMLGVGIGLIILNELGMLTGELAGMAAEVPYLAANVATILIGYLALGGDVPFFNGIPFLEAIGSTGWLIITGVVLVLAVGVDNAD